MESTQLPLLNPSTSVQISPSLSAYHGPPYSTSLPRQFPFILQATLFFRARTPGDIPLLQLLNFHSPPLIKQLGQGLYFAHCSIPVPGTAPTTASTPKG